MRFMRFLIVGGTAALVQLVVLALCLHVLDFRYQFAVGVAYISSVIFHFLVNRQFTFQLNVDPQLEEVVRYLTLVMCNLVITLLVSVFVIEALGLTAYMATVFSSAATIVITFVACKYWVFKKRESA
jgi:putative flippase GtrA